MKRITIEVPEPGDERQMLDVVDEAGNRCNGVNFDEMLGQIVSMTHPKLRGVVAPQYRMELPEVWAAQMKAAFDGYPEGEEK